MPDDISIILFVYSPKLILLNLYCFILFILFRFIPKTPSSLLPKEYTICSFDNIKECSFPQDADNAFILFIFEIFIGSLIFS